MNGIKFLPLQTLLRTNHRGGARRGGRLKPVNFLAKFSYNKKNVVSLQSFRLMKNGQQESTRTLKKLQ